MKKSWKSLLLVVSFAFVAVFAACEDTPEPSEDEETIEVHFYNSEGWDEVYVQSEDHEDLTDGLKATAESGEDKWYSVEFERDVLSNPITIQFTNGGSESSENLEIDHPRQVFTSMYSETVMGSRGGVEDYMTATVYFYNFDEWTTVHASSPDVDMLSDNPEVTAAEEDGWYSVTVPVALAKESFNITFNDGTVANGNELEVSNPDRTYLTKTEVFGNIAEAEAKASGVYTEVYFYNTAGWEDVAAYFWGDNIEDGPAWPGLATVDVDGRDNWVSIVVPGVNPGEEFNIIFNNNGGGAQTGDTVIDTDGEVYLRYNEPVNDNNVPAGKYTSFDEAENPTTTVQFFNEQGWDTVNVQATNSEDATLDGVTITQDEDSLFWTVEIPESVMDNNTVDLTFTDGDANMGDAITITDDNVNSILTSDATITYNARTTIWFNNSGGWTTVEANFSTSETTPRTIASGLTATQDGTTDWYTVDVPTDFENEDYEITFTNGTNSSETVTLTDGSELYLTMTASERYSTLNEANAWMDVESTDLTKVYFYNSEGWTNIHGYNWSNGSNSDTFNEVLGSWPGREATQDGTSDWWYVEIPVDFTQDFIAATDSEDAKGFNLIFNSNEGQTGNILLENMTDIYITADDQVFDNKADAETAMEPTIATDLFISEYLEGSSNNKAIEIYNGTGADVDLTNYTVEQYHDDNPSTIWESYDLTGTLAAGDVFVITTDQAVDTLANAADAELGYPSVAHVGGDDSITLSKNGTIIDVFGIVGETTWQSDLTTEHTLVRKATVTGPTTTWDINEWDSYDQDTFDYIGSHTME